MDESEFIIYATRNPDFAPFLQAVADEARPALGQEQPQHYAVGGLDIIGLFAASALYRWAGIHLEHRRQKLQTDILAEQAAVVSSLVEDGLSAKEAQALVTALMKHNARQPSDDSAVSRVLQLLK